MSIYRTHEAHTTHKDFCHLKYENHHSRRKPHLRRVVSDNAPLPKIHLTIRQLKSCSNPASQSSSLEFIKPERIFTNHIFNILVISDCRFAVGIYISKKRDLKAAPDSLASNEQKSAPENSYPKVSEFLVTASENETVPDGPEKVYSDN